MPERMSIDGFEFLRHPSPTAGAADATSRLKAAAEGLRFVRDQLRPPERAVYLAVCRAEAQILRMLATRREAVKIDGPEPTWLNELAGP